MQVNQYLRPLFLIFNCQTPEYKQSEDDGFIVRELLGNIEGALEQIRISYSRKELNGSIITGAERKTYGSLDEELYFNKLALNCLGTVQNMLELFEKR